MTGALFVSKGHGERASADRIAADVLTLAPAMQIDHLPLVGEGESPHMREVGPRRTMPSGGLIAMGNLRNIVRDVRGGLIALTFAQRRFLRGARGRYALAVAIGDTYAYATACVAKAPTIFVGTAKSVNVAPYGPFEERLIRGARAIFVRDAPTAERLVARGVRAEATGNAIVDLYDANDDRAAEALAGFAPAFAILPGSRDGAYDDARFMADVLRSLARRRPSAGGELSLAPGLADDRFAETFARDGWEICRRDDERIPFELRAQGRVMLRAWRGAVGSLFGGSTLVLGQAGTANEAAAAAGLPIVAFDIGSDRKSAWYRERQRGLLGDALAVFPGNVEEGAEHLDRLLDDRERLERMRATGRERMGAPGGARAIAERIVACAEES